MHDLTPCSGHRLPLLEWEWEIIAQQLSLSPREVQIVRRILTGENERTIALRIGMSPHTVHEHLKRVYLKLDVASRLELVLRIFAEYAAIARQEVIRGQSVARPALHRAAA